MRSIEESAEQDFGEFAAETVRKLRRGTEDLEDIQHLLPRRALGKAAIAAGDLQQLRQRSFVIGNRRERLCKVEPRLQVRRIRLDSRRESLTIAGPCPSQTDLRGQSIGRCTRLVGDRDPFEKLLRRDIFPARRPQASQAEESPAAGWIELDRTGKCRLRLRLATIEGPCLTLDGGDFSRGRNNPVDKAAQLVDGHRSYQIEHRAALFEGDQAGDALDAECVGNLRTFVDIHPGKQESAVVFTGKPLDLRAQGAARATPGRPEVDDHRQRARAIDHRRLEFRVPYVNDPLAHIVRSKSANLIAPPRRRNRLRRLWAPSLTLPEGAGTVRAPASRESLVEWLIVTLNLYRDAFSRAAVLSARNWPVLLSVFAYSGIMSVAMMIVAPLGIIGGMIFSAIWAACVGSFLYLVEMIVRTTRVTMADFRRSFGVYLGDVLGVMFVLWILNMIVGPLLIQSDYALPLSIFLSITIFVLFNAVPELIYFSHSSSVALLAESYRFISNNWIEWFPANFAAAAVVFFVWQVPLSGPAEVLQLALISLLTYFVMVMRGLLFQELATSSYRSRAFKYRARM